MLFVLGAITVLSLGACGELTEELNLDPEDVRDLEEAAEALNEAAERAAEEDDGLSDSERAFRDCRGLCEDLTYVGPADTSFRTRPPIPLDYGGVQTEGWQALDAESEVYYQSETWEYDDPLAFEALVSTYTAEYGPPDPNPPGYREGSYAAWEADQFEIEITRTDSGVTLQYAAGTPAG